MKLIRDEDYIQIAAYGYSQCNCKKVNAKKVIDKFKDYKISSICGGKVITSDGTREETVIIFLKD